LSKEEGGQALMNLHIKTAAFCVQFIQRLLPGSSGFGWRVGRLRMDESLFFLDPLKLDASNMPILYRNLFKVWILFNQQRCMKSLFWLLNEPIIHGARLDVSRVELAFLD